ncbi:MAG: hypothetical protein NTX97_00450 [Bacteroidetes bacterium]|nr:hypothetical protein [Bacteroidota bacterium]
MKIKFLILFIFITATALAQPFADILSFNFQTFSSNYKDSVHWKNKTDDYFLNFFLPKEFKNGQTLLVRLNTEMMNSTISPDSSYSSRLSSISLPVGMKLVTKNKKWETVVLVIPKIASDFKDVIDGYDLQYGGIFLQHYVPNNKLKIKAGLYYNHEAFGNFFVPLVGVDWRINDRINLYGVLPTNYKMEFNIIKNKLYAGINFKSFTRSFRLSQKNKYDYVRYDEMQVKLFVDYFVVPKVLVFAELGYSIGKSPLQYIYDTKDKIYSNPVYTPIKNYPMISLGVAYRVRFDLEKKEPVINP